jgi:RimJ/RimL family protein N-acetyltransferase
MTILRDLAIEDLDLLVRWRNDTVVNLYLSNRLKSREEAEVWFNKLKANPKIWLKAIIENSRIIGYAAVESIDEKNRQCELAIVIGETDCWGNGIGTGVLKTMLEYAFDTLCMHRVWAAVARGNDRSERLVKRAGFV